MKKITLFLVFFFSITNISNAFFGGVDSLDLYKNIDSSYEENIDKLYKIESNGLGKFQSQLNNKLSKEFDKCKVNRDFSSKDLEKIKNGNLEIIVNSLEQNCFDENGNLPNKTLFKIKDEIEKLDSKNRIKAKEKNKQLQMLSTLGVYADGNIENSGFDIISDIEDIDAIIFSSQNKYIGAEDNEIDDYFDKFNPEKGVTHSDNPDFNEKGEIISYDKKTEKIEILSEFNTNNNLVCSKDNSETGLNNKNLFFTINEINKISENKILENEIILENKEKYEIDSENKGSYSSISDSSECDSFFCIDIDFVTYNHNLLGGGEQITIEYLLNRSNKHLRKFSSTSLAPAKMTLNNFELGLKDLNLADMFHMGIIITSKPVPILEGKKDSGDEDKLLYGVESQLKRYYQNIGLNYNRRNDISLLNKIPQDKQKLLSSARGTIKQSTEKSEPLNKELQKGEYKNEFFTYIISQKNSHTQTSKTEERFREIETFTKSIKNYAIDINSIIGEMLKIPNG